jgi:hypothetical protein
MTTCVTTLDHTAASSSVAGNTSAGANAAGDDAASSSSSGSSSSAAEDDAAECAVLLLYLTAHPFVRRRVTSTDLPDGTKVTVQTFQVDPTQFRKKVQAERKVLGDALEAARCLSTKATRTFNAARRAMGSARSKQAKQAKGVQEPKGLAEEGEEEELEKELEVLRAAKAEAEVQLCQAQRAFDATKKPSITDDDVYAADPELQQRLPRGCHIVTFAAPDGAASRVFLLTGLCKFGGMLLTDEDEEDAGDPKDGGEFKAKGKDDDGRGAGKSPASSPVAEGGGGSSCEDKAGTVALPEGTTVLHVTDKSNGENCKWALVRFLDAYYVLFGSKNTCEVRRLDAHDVGATLGDDDPSQCVLPWQNVGHVALRWLRQQSPSTLDKIEGVVFCGELLRPWAEHVVRITYGIELFAVSLRGAAQDLDRTWALFAELGITPTSGEMRCVGRHVYPAADLDKVVAEIRQRADSEGAVIYLANRGVPVLWKVKASEYVLNRSMREVVKGLLRNLAAKSSATRPAKLPAAQRASVATGVQTTEAATASQDTCSLRLTELVVGTKTRMTRRMRMLTHVPGCAQHCDQWAERACGFVDYLVCRFLKCSADGTAFTGLDALRAGVGGKFATLVCEFDAARTA